MAGVQGLWVGTGDTSTGQCLATPARTHCHTVLTPSPSHQDYYTFDPCAELTPDVWQLPVSAALVDMLSVCVCSVCDKFSDLFHDGI